MVANVVQLTDNRKQIQQISRAFSAQREAFRAQPMPSGTERREHLKRLKRVLLANQDALCDAISEDFGGRSRDETLLAEIMPSIQNINYSLSHLSSWMKPEKRKVHVLFQPARNEVHYEPLGVVGIMVPWNYPLFLAAGPLTAALAAGNRVMLKLSEFTPATSAMLERLLHETFPSDLVTVINGEADVAQAFSSQPFDHLLFTGSTPIGRMVMKAAAENLTPVTLELGGKSPAIISREVPMKDAAERIAFGKCINAGQTCVAPDYILCPRDRVNSFVDSFRSAVARMYPTIKDNPDYTSIINERQHERLTGVLDDARGKGADIIQINPGNEYFGEDTRKLPPHLVLGATQDMQVLQDEVFGPLLPIVAYDQLEDALDYVNSGPNPLALYYFGYDRSEQRRVREQTHSGGMCINDTLVHVGQDDLPFGGVGHSGMGAYHGREGFVTFSNARGVMSKQRLNSGKAIHAPHGTLLHRVIYKLFIR
ncbi:coniferyl aldehyde dehydrogenase [uncultured Halovibrio sp.]|uniref:coniferyl aldehyde dehydrogenase n=1 Tax=uncultured Halovibrio sp. TaxID=985049 RepID=UPI0025F3BD44|nr:coniferyl aldehyde dehydrogenase [uncultured Halovibrio sp.]